MLTAEELDGLAETAESNLPDVLNVIEIEYDRGPRGEAEEIAVTGPDIPCRVKPVSQGQSSAQEAVILEKLGAIDAWKIRVPFGTILRGQDRVIVDLEASPGPREMEIASVPGSKSYQSVGTFYAVEIG